MKQESCFGIKMSVFTQNELTSYFIDRIEKSERTIYYGYSFGLFPAIKRTPKLYNIIESFDVILADGRWFYLFTKAIGIPLKCDISLPQFVMQTLEIANEKGLVVQLLGGTQEVVELAQKRIRNTYPRINLMVPINGYFNYDAEPCIVDLVNDIKPDILLIGISSPKKEEFVDRWRDKLEVNAIIPCGGMIDVLAGKTKITPKWIKKLGFAWLYRLAQEPRRLLLPRLELIFDLLFYLFPRLILDIVLNGRKNANIVKPYLKYKNYM